MIAFSGLDGAGKSTQIALIHILFTDINKRSQVFWSRGGYTPGMSLIKLILRKSGSNLIPLTAGHSKKRDEVFKNIYVKKIWLTLAIVDLFFCYAVLLRFKQFLGYKIICDRYIIDSEIDFILNFPEENVDRWWIWRILKTLSFKPEHHFVLTIPVEESVRRSIVKNEPFPDSPQTLKIRLKKYMEFIQSKGYVHHIDGQKSVDEIAFEIKSILGL